MSGPKPGSSSDDLDVVASMLGHLAHDLRSPLGSLALWLPQLAKECARAGVAGDILPMIEGATRTLTHLGEDLDDAAQILRGTLKLHRRPVDLRGLLETVHGRLCRRAGVKEVQVRMALEPDRALVVGDRKRLERLLHALVESALAGARAGTVVETRLQVEDGRALVCIAPPPVGTEGLPRLREFLALPASERRGLGFSLALARHLLEGHGATIELGTSELRIGLALAKPS